MPPEGTSICLAMKAWLLPERGLFFRHITHLFTIKPPSGGSEQLPNPRGTQYSLLPLKTVAGWRPAPMRPSRERSQNWQENRRRRWISSTLACFSTPSTGPERLPWVLATELSQELDYIPTQMFPPPPHSREGGQSFLLKKSCSGAGSQQFSLGNLSAGPGGSPRGGRFKDRLVAMCGHGREHVPTARAAGLAPSTVTSVSQPLHLPRPGQGYIVSLLPLLSLAL